MERACADLAAAVYLPREEIQPYLDARDVGRHVAPLAAAGAGGR